jgi:hypothetical protein
MRKMALIALPVAAGVLIAGGVAGAARGGTANTTTVHLTGSQETSGGSGGSGVFQFQLLPSRGLLCYSLTWSDIGTPTASHIHKAPRGKAGNVLIVLSGTAPVAHSGCRQAPKSVLVAIGKDPGAYYVNVHTAQYPMGAIRGQL